MVAPSAVVGRAGLGINRPAGRFIKAVTDRIGVQIRAQRAGIGPGDAVFAERFRLVLMLRFAPDRRVLYQIRLDDRAVMHDAGHRQGNVQRARPERALTVPRHCERRLRGQADRGRQRLLGEIQIRNGYVVQKLLLRFHERALAEPERERCEVCVDRVLKRALQVRAAVDAIAEVVDARAADSELAGIVEFEVLLAVFECTRRSQDLLRAARGVLHEPAAVIPEIALIVQLPVLVDLVGVEGDVRVAAAGSGKQRACTPIHHDDRALMTAQLALTVVLQVDIEREVQAAPFAVFVGIQQYVPVHAAQPRLAIAKRVISEQEARALRVGQCSRRATVGRAAKHGSVPVIDRALNAGIDLIPIGGRGLIAVHARADAGHHTAVHHDHKEHEERKQRRTRVHGSAAAAGCPQKALFLLAFHVFHLETSFCGLLPA